MLSVEEVLITRVANDTTLQGLLGGSGRVFHTNSFQGPKSPGVYYRSFSAMPGQVNGDVVTTREEIFSFMIFSGRTPEVEDRLIKLLHQYTLTEQSDAGGLRVVWDSSGPELFDEDLQVEQKDVRFRVFIVPKAYAPI